MKYLRSFQKQNFWKNQVFLIRKYRMLFFIDIKALVRWNVSMCQKHSKIFIIKCLKFLLFFLWINPETMSVGLRLLEIFFLSFGTSTSARPIFTVVFFNDFTPLMDSLLQWCHILWTLHNPIACNNIYEKHKLPTSRP